MKAYTQSMVNLIEEFSRLPGIGHRTAERLAYHILSSSAESAMALANTIRDVKTNIRHCSRCFNFAEGDLCEICRDPSRDLTTICVVERPNDVISVEKTGQYTGLYHVLLGHLSPLDGIGPEDITVAALVERVKSDGTKEIILATNPNLEGDATALYIGEQLAATGIVITRPARGLPSGGSLEHASKVMLADAIKGRQRV